MTDKQIERLFNSITTFSKFKDQAYSEQDIELESISIQFISDEKVRIAIDNEILTLTKSQFNSILKELSQNSEIKAKHEVNLEIELIRLTRKNELTRVDDLLFQVEEEYYNEMFGARDTATGHPTYSKKLKEILALLNDGKTILIKGIAYNNINNFIQDHITNQNGFISLDNELKP